jgi:hypothetical protein
MLGGGEVIGDLILRESEEFSEVRVTWNLDWGLIYFFCSKKILAGTDVWTP